MTGPRLIQNFSGTRALLIGVPDVAAVLLRGVLSQLGLTVEAVEATPEALKALAAGVHYERDILIVDGDADVPVVEPLAGTSRLALAPVIALVGVETPGRLRMLVGLGATAFIRKPVQQSGIYSALFLGINGYRSRRFIEELIAEHEERRRGRRALVKAVVKLMGQEFDDDAAYELLRKSAMRSRLTVEAYSAALVDGANGLVRDGQDVNSTPSKIRL